MGTRMTHGLEFLTLTLLIASCATVEEKPNHQDAYSGERLQNFIVSQGDAHPDPAYIEQISQMTRPELEEEINVNSKELIKAIAAEKKARSAYGALEKQYEEEKQSDPILFSEVLMARAESWNAEMWGRLLESKRDALLMAYRKLLWKEKGYKR